MSAVQSPVADGSERRVAARMRTLKRAKVLFNNHFSTYDCIVKNLSQTGALLTIDEAVHLPKLFDVLIGEDKDCRPARLVYRRGALAGIRFLDVELDPSDPANREESQAADAPPVAAPQRRESSVRRLQSEVLPEALTRNFRWA